MITFISKETNIIKQAVKNFQLEKPQNKVQFLKGIFREILLSVILREQTGYNSLEFFLEKEYIKKGIGTEKCAKKLNKIMNEIPEKIIEEYRLELFIIFEEKFPFEKAKGGKYTDALKTLDVLNDEKFSIINIQKNGLFLFLKHWGIHKRNLSEAQKIN